MSQLNPCRSRSFPFQETSLAIALAILCIFNSLLVETTYAQSGKRSQDDVPDLIPIPGSIRIADLQHAQSVPTAQPMVGPQRQQTADPSESLAGPSSETEPVAVADIEQALDRKGSITFRKTALSEVFFLLSDLWKVNIVAGENITGEVSGAFYETSLREVLSAVLTTSGYSYRNTGTSLVVLPIDQVGSNHPDFISRTINLPSSIDDVDATIEAAQLLLGERGQLRKLGNGSLLVIDRPERVSRVEALLLSLATQNAPNVSPPQATGQETVSPTVPMNDGIAYFTPQFTEAEEMTESLKLALGDSVIVATFNKENRIMVKGTPDQLRLATQAIQQLDVPRAQVRITALIYDVSLKEAEGLGVNWSHGPHSRSTSLLNPGTAEEVSVFRNAIEAGAGLGLTSPTTTLGFRTLNNAYDANVMLQALSSSAEAKILADPTVTVGDRRQASIRIVQRLPIVTSVVTAAGTVPQVDFQEAGIILNVLPRISRDGTIEMEVKPEYSYKVGEVGANPIIDSRTAETTVRVEDGHLFALGGLRQKNFTEVVRGVPYLKDIKFIGRLFRSHGTEITESELIVFLKPEIVTPYAAGSPRQEQAACIANCQLNGIPYASHQYQTPDCENKYCPNHHPRPRINGGSTELEMIGGYGIEILEPTYNIEVEYPVSH